MDEWRLSSFDKGNIPQTGICELPGFSRPNRVVHYGLLLVCGKDFGFMERRRPVKLTAGFMSLDCPCRNDGGNRSSLCRVIMGKMRISFKNDRFRLLHSQEVIFKTLGYGMVFHDHTKIHDKRITSRSPRYTTLGSNQIMHCFSSDTLCLGILNVNVFLVLKRQ